MTGIGYCPLCGEKLPSVSHWTTGVNVQNIGGWRVCGHHKVYLRPSKYAGRCHECLGPIIPGEVVILWMELEPGTGKKRWSALHRRDRCEGDESIAAGGNANSGPYAKLYLLPDAPVEVVKASYRALASKYHPDLPGGDEARMKELNLAVEEIMGK